MTHAELLALIEEDAGIDYVTIARRNPEAAADDLDARAAALETGSVVTSDDRTMAENCRLYAAELRLHVARSEAA